MTNRPDPRDTATIRELASEVKALVGNYRRLSQECAERGSDELKLALALQGNWKLMKGVSVEQTGDFLDQWNHLVELGNSFSRWMKNNVDHDFLESFKKSEDHEEKIRLLLVARDYLNTEINVEIPVFTQIVRDFEARVRDIQAILASRY